MELQAQHAMAEQQQAENIRNDGCCTVDGEGNIRPTNRCMCILVSIALLAVVVLVLLFTGVIGGKNDDDNDGYYNY